MRKGAKMNLKDILNTVNIGTKIYVDKATQPFLVVAKNKRFIIAIKSNFGTKSIAFDIENNICGYFIGYHYLVNYENKNEVNQLLNNLTVRKFNIVEKTKRITSDVIRKIMKGSETIYGN